MEEIRKHLNTPLEHDNGHALRAQLSLSEAFQALASVEHRKAEQELSDVRGKVYDPSLQTELYRKVDLERNTRSHQAAADQWGDIARILRDRISLGQSFLRSIQGEIEGNLR